ncbi:MAG: HEAT repeat domain-containing protein [Anaerolineales bacterium]|jgi:HEAT repeat protein
MKLLKLNVDKHNARGDCLTLFRARHDKDWEMRSVAAKALGRLRAHGAVPALVRALDDKNRLVRQLVSRAQGRIGEERPVGALVRTSQDPDSRRDPCLM